MSKPHKQVFGPNEFDVRVRERYLASGTIDAKGVEKHLGDLKDVGSNAASVDLPQPALQGAPSAED